MGMSMNDSKLFQNFFHSLKRDYIRRDANFIHLFSIEKSRRSREFSPENPSFSQAGCWIDAKSVCNRVEGFNTKGKRETLPWRLALFVARKISLKVSPSNFLHAKGVQKQGNEIVIVKLN